MSSNVGWIAPSVARDTRVCVYDRAGRGWSQGLGKVVFQQVVSSLSARSGCLA
jgi:hypothetical protein